MAERAKKFEYGRFTPMTTTLNKKPGVKISKRSYVPPAATQRAPSTKVALSTEERILQDMKKSQFKARPVNNKVL